MNIYTYEQIRGEAEPGRSRGRDGKRPKHRKAGTSPWSRKAGRPPDREKLAL